MKSSVISKAKKLKKLIKLSKEGQILIHTSPDGDAIASAIAFFRVVKKLTNKSYHIFCPKPVPKRFQFLPHTSQFKTYPIKSSLSIVLDTGSLKRLPGWEPGADFVVNIDHHDTNPNFGKINIVEPKASSTVEILIEIFRIWGSKIDSITADVLYAGIFSETGGFIFKNTKASTFTNAGVLVKLGANPTKIGRKIINQNIGRLKLLAKALATLKVKNGIAELMVLQEMFKETNTKLEDTEGFVEMPLSIPDVKVSILLKELPDGRTKVSLRSKEINVSRVSKHFGGGGHRLAAGFVTDHAINSISGLLLSHIKK